ncbi:MAG: DsrE/DsrF/DrsH-like family protein [Pseudomonadota bacterium]|nr:DsrE/DsrF/DrsH-like family protein [Pseudomonadota bacterium]
MSKKINIMCVSGAHEKLQMAAMVASVGAACGDDVTVFFSMNAMTYFIKGSTEVAPTEGDFGELLNQDGVPSFRQLFQQAADLGDAKLLPCSMALDLLKVEKDDLLSEFGPPTGLTKFLVDAEGGEILTF